MRRLALALAVSACAALALPAESVLAVDVEKAKPKKCKKGYERKTVKRKGKKVQTCVKKKVKKPAVKPPAAKKPAGGTPTTPTPAPGSGPAPSAPAPAGDGYTPPADAVGAFTQLMASATFSRLKVSGNSTYSASSTGKYRFCANGSYGLHEEYVGSNSSSYEDSQGTWKVEKAAFVKATSEGQTYYRAEAVVAYTTSKNGGGSGQVIVDIFSATPDYANATKAAMGTSANDAVEYSRVAGAAGC